MNQKSNTKNLGIIFLLLSLFILSSKAAIGQLSDKKLADKYGLTILPSNDKLEPAPEWLQKADMITGSNRVWKDYKFTLKDTLLTRMVRMRAGYGLMQMIEYYPVETIGSFDGSIIKGVPLVSHVPHSKKAFEEAHKQGVKVIPYVHFRCIHSNYADQDVFLFEHPEILLKDVEGKWVHTPMDGTDRLFRFLTCANSPVYWKLSLAYVKKMMDWGADGIFIDNLELRQPCLAPRFTTRNPESPPYIHEHLFPDATHDYAWDKMLQAIRTLVKSYGEDKIVILNSGIDTQFQKNGDCCMWENFYNSGGGRSESGDISNTWENIKKRAQKNEWYLKAGRRITASSSFNPSQKDVKNDAYWAFSAARLVDFIWWTSLNGTGAESLYQAHMGKALEPIKEANGIAYRSFDNGIIVLNDSMDDQSVELTLPADFQPRRLLDLYSGSQVIQVKNMKVKVTVAKKTARVYLLYQNL
jgi:hypothetical protein